MNLIVTSVPATVERLQEIAYEQDKDAVCKQVKEYCLGVWPHKSHVKGPVKAFAKVKQELSVNKGLLLRGDRLVIPSSRQSDILNKFVIKCRQRAKQSVWWPNIQQHIEDKVSKCPICCQYRIQLAEPLIYHRSFQNVLGRN